MRRGTLHGRPKRMTNEVRFTIFNLFVWKFRFQICDSSEQIIERMAAHTDVAAVAINFDAGYDAPSQSEGPPSRKALA